MGNNAIIASFWRFLLLLMLQVLVFKPMATSVGPYFNIFIYPIFLLLLPIQTPTPYLVLLGALMGFCADEFYYTGGLHASAGAFAGLVRRTVLSAFAPNGNFTPKEPVFTPVYVSWQTFLPAAGLYFFAHILWFYVMDAFTFVYIGEAILKTLAAWPLSMIFVLAFMMLFRPKA
jgi:hypothetical protein